MKLESRAGGSFAGCGGGVVCVGGGAGVCGAGCAGGAAVKSYRVI